jgi:hypothetical protein
MSMCDNSTMHIDQSIETLLSKWACNVSIFTFSLKHVAWSFICIRICVWMIRMKRDGKPTSDWSIERSISRSVEYVTYCCHESDIELYAWKTVNMWVGSIDQSKVSRVYVTTTHTHTSTKYVQSIDGNVKWGSKILCASDRVSIWVRDVVSITDLLTTSSNECIVVHLMHCDHVDKAAARLSNIFESHPNSGPTSCPSHQCSMQLWFVFRVHKASYFIRPGYTHSTLFIGMLNAYWPSAYWRDTPIRKRFHYDPCYVSHCHLRTS